ncbi:Miraculin [Glycine soja]|uniref:Miraculin n=1 Tax=Glycine soja TaxID=3848 RepID=A0A0B2R327_GLYSO|nr:Miraculin [Glycine soja]
MKFITLLASFVLILFALSSQPLLGAVEGSLEQKSVTSIYTDLNIMFLACNITCPHHSTMWKIDNFNVSKGHGLVTTGGGVGNSGKETIGNWFNIVKYDGAYNYKIAYCLSMCPSCKHECKNVGMVMDQNGNQCLALSDVPFQFRFFKA